MCFAHRVHYWIHLQSGFSASALTKSQKDNLFLKAAGGLQAHAAGWVAACGGGVWSCGEGVRGVVGVYIEL